MNNIKKIRNGSLYFNERRNQVERVLGAVNSQRVWTKRHQEDTNDVQIKNLRVADKGEVDCYVEESVPALLSTGGGSCFCVFPTLAPTFKFQIGANNYHTQITINLIEIQSHLAAPRAAVNNSVNNFS